jgi:hypothetical protein
MQPYDRTVGTLPRRTRTTKSLTTNQEVCTPPLVACYGTGNMMTVSDDEEGDDSVDVVGMDELCVLDTTPESGGTHADLERIDNDVGGTTPVEQRKPLCVYADRCVATSLASITLQQSVVDKLQTIATLVHSIRKDAYDLITHHVLRCLELGNPVPDLKNLAVINRFIQAVTTNNRSSESYAPLDREIEETRVSRMSNFQRHTLLPGCVYILEYERKRFRAPFETMINRTFKERVGRLVEFRLRLDDATLESMTSTKKKERRRFTKLAMAYATRVGGPKGLPEEHATVVKDVVAHLGLHQLCVDDRGASRTVEYMLKADPTRFLAPLNAINRELEVAGERRFQLLPLVTSNVPGFMTIDQRALKEIVDLGREDRRRIADQKTERKDEVRPFKQRLRELRLELSRNERTWKSDDFKKREGRMIASSVLTDIVESIFQSARPTDDDETESTRTATGKWKRTPKQRALPTKGSKRPRRKAPAPTLALTPSQIEEDAEEKTQREPIASQLNRQITEIESDTRYKELCDDAVGEKRDMFCAAFSVTKKVVRHPEQWQYSLSTNGYSARLMLKRPQYFVPPDDGAIGQPSTTKGVSATLSEMPRAGIHALADIAPLVTKSHKISADVMARLCSLPPIQLNEELNKILCSVHGGDCPYIIIGIDPGKLELIVASNPDVTARNHAERHELPLPATEQERKDRPEAQAATRYTSKQRKFETTPGRYILNKKGRDSHERVDLSERAKAYRESIKPTDPVLLRDTLVALSAHTRSAATSDGFKAFTDARLSAQPVLNATYADDGLLHRKLRWKAFIDKQKSLQGLVNQLKAIERSTGKQIILAYGAWGLQAGKPGSAVNRGNPPCLGVSLATFLARFFVVAWVPEHYTSKTCFHCGCHECCNHEKIANKHHRQARDERALKRRDERLAIPGISDAAKAKAEQIYKKTIAKTPELRGLRFCPGCTRCLNRDRNAASNIGLQFKRLVFGLGTIKHMEEYELELHGADTHLSGTAA